MKQQRHIKVASWFVFLSLCFLTNGVFGPEVSLQIMLMSALGIVELNVVFGVVDRARGGNTRVPLGTGLLGTDQSVQDTASHVREKEIVSERFLGMYAFCGSKNAQGTINCHSCGAKL